MNLPGKKLAFAFALAGAGHAAFLGALFTIRAGSPRPADPAEVECVIELDSGGNDVDAPNAHAAASAGTPAPPAATNKPAANPEKLPETIPAPPTPKSRETKPAPEKPPPVPPPAPPAPIREKKPPTPVGTTVAPAATKVSAGLSEKKPSAAGSGAGQGTGAGTGRGQGNAAGDTTAPRYRRKIEPDYPDRARRLGVEGDVVLRIHIAENGEPSAAEVKKSSGSRLLDEAAMDAAMESAYEPARRDGRAVRSVAEAPVSFRLENK